MTYGLQKKLTEIIVWNTETMKVISEMKDLHMRAIV